MSLIFSLRGNSITPRYARGGKLYHSYLGPANYGNPPAPVTPGSIGASGAFGNLLDVHITNADERSVKYQAGRNWVCNGSAVFSLRIRLVPTWSGAPAYDMPIFVIGANVNYMAGGLRIYIYDNGHLHVALGSANDSGALYVSAVSTAALSLTAGVATDIMVTCDGSTVYASQDGSALTFPSGHTFAPSAQYHADGVLAGSIHVAPYPANFYLDELNIWDSLESHTYSPRSAYETCADLDGTLVPAVSDIRTGVASGNGTGTLDVPTAAQTKHGVAVDGGTGTYRGYDLWEAVLASEMSSGVTHLQDGVSVIGTRDTVTNLIEEAVLVGQDTAGVLLEV